MASDNDLIVHDLSTSEQPFFGPGGVIKKQTRVTFYVGSHGPFTLTYDEGQGSAERIQNDINARVRDLRVITSADYTG
jgi:hypothetical protein